MSDHEIIRQARSSGKKAYWDGYPRSHNPLRALVSRNAWFSGWDEESKLKAESDKRMADFENGNRHALKGNYFCDVDI